MNIGKVFKRAREERGLSQRSMAKLLNITPAALWKIENGKNWPKPGTIDALCKESGISRARVYIEAIEPSDYIE